MRITRCCNHHFHYQLDRNQNQMLAQNVYILFGQVSFRCQRRPYCSVVVFWLLACSPFLLPPLLRPCHLMVPHLRLVCGGEDGAWHRAPQTWCQMVLKPSLPLLHRYNYHHLHFFITHSPKKFSCHNFG